MHNVYIYNTIGLQKIRVSFENELLPLESAVVGSYETFLIVTLSSVWGPKVSRPLTRHFLYIYIYISENKKLHNIK